MKRCAGKSPGLLTAPRPAPAAHLTWAHSGSKSPPWYVAFAFLAVLPGVGSYSHYEPTDLTSSIVKTRLGGREGASNVVRHLDFEEATPMLLPLRSSLLAGETRPLPQGSPASSATTSPSYGSSGGAGSTSPAPPGTLPGGIHDWLETCHHHRPRTVYDLERAAMRWLAAWGEAPLAALDPEAIRTYVIGYREHHAASTANHERTLLSWFFAHVVRRGLLLRSPVEGSPRYPEETREPRCLRQDEVSRLLAHADARLRAIITVAVETGLRRQTIIDLRWEWITPDGWIQIPSKYMKGRRDYRAPLSEAAQAAFRSIQAATQGRVFSLSRTSLSRAFTHAAALASVDCTFHDLRRTFFTRMREAGVPLEVAMALSDHRDYRTALRHYRAIRPEELLQAVHRQTRRNESFGV